MNILLVEDRGVVTYYLREALEEAGHIVFSAPNILRAKYYWDQGGINCIIVDLNMDPEGLSDQERGETKGGLFTGWVWLRNHVLAKDASMKGRAIILTAYLDQLKEKLRSDQAEKLFSGLTFVRKRQVQYPETGAIVELVSAIAKECEKGEQ